VGRQQGGGTLPAATVAAHDAIDLQHQTEQQLMDNLAREMSEQDLSALLSPRTLAEGLLAQLADQTEFEGGDGKEETMLGLGDVEPWVKMEESEVGGQFEMLAIKGEEGDGVKPTAAVGGVDVNICEEPNTKMTAAQIIASCKDASMY